MTDDLLEPQDDLNDLLLDENMQVEIGEPEEEKSPIQLRWLALLILIAGLGVYTLVFSPFRSTLFLIAVIVIGMFITVSDAELNPRNIPGSIRANLSNTLTFLRDLQHERREFTGIFLGLLGLLFMTLAALSFVPLDTEDWIDDGLFLLLSGGLLVGFSTYLLRPLETARFLSVLPLSPSRANLFYTSIGLVLLMMTAEMSANSLGSPFIDGISTHIQFVIFMGGIVFTIAGMSGGLEINREEIKAKAITYRTEIIVVSLLALFALVIRVWGLDQFLRASIDEGISTQGILNVWWDRDVGIAQAPSQYISTYLYPYIQSLIVQLTGTTFFMHRFPSALTGTIGVIGIYLLARTMFQERRTAVVAALVLATFPPHVHFSRLGLSHVADATNATFAALFIVRALQSNRRVDWVLGGVFTGLSQYFFEAGRLFVPVFVTVWLIISIFLSPSATSVRWRGMVMLVLTTLFIAFPMQYTIASSEGESAARFATSSLGADYWSNLLQDGITGDVIREVLNRFSLPFQSYLRMPPTAFFYGGETPLVLHFAVPFLLVGFFYLLSRLNPLTVGLVLWVFLVPLSNGFLRDIFVYARYVIVFPALALTISVGISRFLPELVPPLSQRLTSRRLRVVVVGLVTVVILCMQTLYYFNIHLPTLNAQVDLQEQSLDGLDVMLRADALLPPRTQIWVISDPLADNNVMRPWLAYLRNNADDQRVDIRLPVDVTPEFFTQNLDHSWNLAFFVDPEDAETIGKLNEIFDLEEGELSPFDIAEETQYLMFFVPEDAPRHLPVIDEEPSKQSH